MANIKAQESGKAGPVDGAANSSDTPSLAFEHVFIVTYGRSGSTLLQGLLNSIDGMLVRGENYNFVYNFFEAYEALCKAKKIDGEFAIHPRNAWFGIGNFDQEAFLGDVRQTVQRIILGDRAGDTSIKCMGFKEIRYPETGEKLAAYLDFLTLAFPKTAFVILTRDLKQVQKSAWWRGEDPESVNAFLSAFEDRADDYARDAGNCFRIDYKDIVEKAPALQDMFAFLGAAYNEADVARVLSISHSYQPGLSYEQNKEPQPTI